MFGIQERRVASEGTGQGWVRTRVIREMSARGWNQADLVRASGLTPDTVSDFLTGKRWPQQSTRAKIAEGLGWTGDSLTLIEMGRDPIIVGIGAAGSAHINVGGNQRTETVGPVDQDAGVLASLPPEALAGLDEADRAEVIAAAKLSALEKAREIRRRLGE